MNDLYRRWLEPRSVQAAVSSMLRTFGSVPPEQSEKMQDERTRLKSKYTLMAAVSTIVFLVVVIGALVLFAHKPEGGKANYRRLALLCFGMVAAAGAGVYLTCETHNRKRARRDEAFEELCQRHPGLRPARRTAIEGSSVGTVPWFHSEEWLHTFGLASGEYEGSQIIEVECTHVVDPILVTTDSRWMQGLAGIASSKHKRLFRREMDAIIFAQPLPDVSDLLFVPRMDPSRAYYKRALAGQDCDLANVFKLPRELRRKYWMAAAEPQECGALFSTRLPELLASRKWCIVQVVGGYCVVITSQWHGNYPGRAPSTLASITANLAFAQAVYQQLRLCSAGSADRSAAVDQHQPQPTSVAISTSGSGEAVSPSVHGWAEPEGVATAVAEPETTYPLPAACSAEPSALARAATPRMPGTSRRRPHSILAKIGLLGIGVPLLLIGVLATMAFSLNRHRGLAAGSWPRADARITGSVMDAQSRHRNGQAVLRFKPRVSYEYEVNGHPFTGDRFMFGVESATMSKQEADRVLARYPKDAAVEVHYNADHPDVSVLKPGLLEESKLTAYIGVTGAFTLIGLLLSGYALIGKRVRPR